MIDEELEHEGAKDLRGFTRITEASAQETLAFFGLKLPSRVGGPGSFYKSCGTLLEEVHAKTEEAGKAYMTLVEVQKNTVGDNSTWTETAIYSGRAYRAVRSCVYHYFDTIDQKKKK